MELIINGNIVSLTHKPITLRNADKLTEWAKRCKEHVQTTNTGAQNQFFVELMEKHPDLLEVMTIDGGINPKAIARFIEREKESIERHNQNIGEGEEPIVVTDEELGEKAIAHVKKTVENMMKDSPAIAKIMQFTMPLFGTDLASLKLGIECIVATYDDSKYDDDQNAEIKDTSADHWLDASAVEVAAYVNNFLAKVS